MQWKNIIWFFVTPPASTLKVPSKKYVVCHNCRTKISVCDELRITTSAIRKGVVQGSFKLITMSFHAKSKCLLDWDYYQQVGKKMNQLHLFSKKVALSPDLKLLLQHQQQLDELVQAGISVVSQNSI